MDFTNSATTRGKQHDKHWGMAPTGFTTRLKGKQTQALKTTGHEPSTRPKQQTRLTKNYTAKLPTSYLMAYLSVNAVQFTTSSLRKKSIYVIHNPSLLCATAVLAGLSQPAKNTFSCIASQIYPPRAAHSIASGLPMKDLPIPCLLPLPQQHRRQFHSSLSKLSTVSSLPWPQSSPYG